MWSEGRRRFQRSGIRLAAALAAAVLSAWTPASDVLDGVWVFSGSEDTYRRLVGDPPAAHRPGPRLVVVRDGRPVLERRLRGVDESGRALEGVYETASVATDHRMGLVLTTRTDGDGMGRTRLTWIDVEYPEGRWRVDLEPGRLPVRSLALAQQRGVFVSTARDTGAPADLRMYDAEGTLRYHLHEGEAWTIGLVTGNRDAFVIAELAYPERGNLPDRGVMIFDMLAGWQWVYTWSYGGDDEPLSWELLDNGCLAVQLPERTQVYDRTGRLIRSSKR